MMYNDVERWAMDGFYCKGVWHTFTFEISWMADVAEELALWAV